MRTTTILSLATMVFAASVSAHEGNHGLGGTLGKVPPPPEGSSGFSSDPADYEVSLAVEPTATGMPSGHNHGEHDHGASFVSLPGPRPTKPPGSFISLPGPGPTGPSYPTASKPYFPSGTGVNLPPCSGNMFSGFAKRPRPTAVGGGYPKMELEKPGAGVKFPLPCIPQFPKGGKWPKWRKGYGGKPWGKHEEPEDTIEVGEPSSTITFGDSKPEVPAAPSAPSNTIEFEEPSSSITFGDSKPEVPAIPGIGLGNPSSTISFGDSKPEVPAVPSAPSGTIEYEEPSSSITFGDSKTPPMIPDIPSIGLDNPSSSITLGDTKTPPVIPDDAAIGLGSPSSSITYARE